MCNQKGSMPSELQMDVADPLKAICSSPGMLPLWLHMWAVA